jgi:serine/threonine-protein kinase
MSAHVFGKYRLIAELGQGGMADVLLAVMEGRGGFSKLVVLKRLREHLRDEAEFTHMLIDEARLAARLNHPNCVQTLEVGEHEGRCFIAMEFLEGQTLARVRRRAWRQERDVSLTMQMQILADVLGGLHHAHEMRDYDGTPLRIVHRDVTPSNVFITYDGAVKLLDFGIAKATGRTTRTQTGVVKGKMGYMPPEQAMGKAVDRRADVFAVGVMLWEAAAGARFWGEKEDIVILGCLLRGEVPVSPRAVEPTVSETIDAICQKALAVDRDQRYATAAEMKAALDEEIWRRQASHAVREQLGKIVGELFTEEREELRAIIETQLAKIEGAGNLPETSLVNVAPSLTPSASKRIVPIDTDVDPEAPTSLPRSAPLREPESTGGLTPSRTDAAPGSHTLESARKPPRWIKPAFAVGLVAAAAAAAWALGPRTREGAPPSVQSAAAREAVPERPHVRVTLRATPPTARFAIDDGPWLDNPFQGELPADGRAHEIRVEAADYLPQRLPVRFDRDVRLEVALERQTAEPAATPGTGEPPSSTKGLPATAPSGSKRKPRDLMHEDPWRD